MPMSCKSWLKGLPVRDCSWISSSCCRSSMRPRSVMLLSNGLEGASDIQSLPGGGWRRVRVLLRAQGHRQIVLLQLRQDGRRILRLGDHFFAGNHALLIFFHEETVE